MLPATLPIFPLPNVVLFPNVFLPLHIFEPRYREMVADALAADRMIGMVLLRPGWEADYEGRPPVYEVGCAGLVTFSEQHPDGRYNIVLRGFEKFRVLGEQEGGRYRLARVQPLPEEPDGNDELTIRAERQRLEAVLAPHADGRHMEHQLPPSMADGDLVNALAQYLDLEPVEKQALLEREGLVSRCRSLTDLLEMKAIAAARTWHAH
jgi:Lon protease-like protein